MTLPGQGSSCCQAADTGTYHQDSQTSGGAVGIGAVSGAVSGAVLSHGHLDGSWMG